MKALWGRLGNFPSGLRSSTGSRSLPPPLSWQPGVLGQGAPARRAGGRLRPEPAPAPNPHRLCAHTCWSQGEALWPLPTGETPAGRPPTRMTGIHFFRGCLSGKPSKNSLHIMATQDRKTQYSWKSTSLSLLLSKLLISL